MGQMVFSAAPNRPARRSIRVLDLISGVWPTLPLGLARLVGRYALLVGRHHRRGAEQVLGPANFAGFFGQNSIDDLDVEMDDVCETFGRHRLLNELAKSI